MRWRESLSCMVRMGAVLAAMSGPAWGMELSSPGMVAGGRLPRAQVLDRFGCAGANRSPALVWSGAPVGTRGYAVTMFDPDAQGGAGWWHWGVAGLPATSLGLAAGADAGGLPTGVLRARNDFGFLGYGGACPPPGPPHRYVIAVYALDRAAPPAPGGEGVAALLAALAPHILDRAALTVTYGR